MISLIALRPNFVCHPTPLSGAHREQIRTFELAKVAYSVWLLKPAQKKREEIGYSEGTLRMFPIFIKEPALIPISHLEE